MCVQSSDGRCFRMNDECAVPYMGEDTSSPFPSYPQQGFATSRCAVDCSGSNSAYVPFRTKSSSVTAGGDRAVLGIMQIVTSAVRVFSHVMPLDILSLPFSVSFSTNDGGQKRTIGVPRCWDDPACLDFSDSNIVQFVGNGCALRHCRRVPSQGEVRKRRRGGVGFAALLPVVRLVWLQPQQHAAMFGGHEPVLWPSCVSCTAKLKQKRNARLADGV